MCLVAVKNSSSYTIQKYLKLSKYLNYLFFCFLGKKNWRLICGFQQQFDFHALRLKRPIVAVKTVRENRTAFCWSYKDCSELDEVSYAE